jgi:hypothetical protein
MTFDHAELVSNWYKSDLVKNFLLHSETSVDDIKRKLTTGGSDEKYMIISLLDDTPIALCSYSKFNKASCHVDFMFPDGNYEDHITEGMQLLLAFLYGTLGMKMIFSEIHDGNTLLERYMATVGFETTGKKNEKQPIKLLTGTLDSFKASIKQPFNVV